MLMIQTMISCGENVNSSEASTFEKDSLPVLNSAEKLMTALNSENSLDWAGTYSGVLPCENCEGIDVTLILNKDETFQQKLRYINSSEETESNFEGSFSWSGEGDKIILEGVEGYSEYKVGEMFLLPLDENGKELNPVPGNNFQLLKE